MSWARGVWVLAVCGCARSDEEPRLVQVDWSGKSSSRTTYEYDERGNQTVQENDDDVDGSIEWRRTTTWDDDRILTDSVDYPSTGKVESRFSYEWTDDTHAVVLYDDGGDGKFEMEEANTYDAQGNVLVSDTDYEIDGTIDRRDSYSYNDAGDLLDWDYDDEADEVIDAGSHCTYDDDGRVTSWVYWDANTGYEESLVFTYESDALTVAAGSWFDAYTSDGDGFVRSHERSDSSSKVWWSATVAGPAVASTYCEAFGWVGAHLVPAEGECGAPGCTIEEHGQDFDGTTSDITWTYESDR